MAVLDDTIIDLDIDVNLTNCYISSVHVNQYEHNGDENNGRNVKCKIYKNGLPFILPDISLIYITATRKDGTQIFQTLQDFDSRCRIEDEYIVIPIINKLTDFGNKWGLSEQDLVTFGNTALDQFGINIAQVKDLEAAFRAVYPEQYQIRLQRMTPNQSSQIYGGTAIPEGTRAQAARAEDAYVEAFLKSHMPNYDAFNKK